jgi:hypothetical protein
VEIKKGDEFAVTAKGRQRDLENLEISVENGKLTIHHTSSGRICIFCSSKSIEISLTMPELNSIDMSGATQVRSDSFDADDFLLNLSGASRAQLEINAATITANLDGASRAQITGIVGNLDTDLSGASRFYGQLLETQTAKVNLSGASQAHVNVFQELEIVASGASRVYYSGEPKIKQSLSGASRVAPEESERPENYGPLQLVEPFVE